MPKCSARSSPCFGRSDRDPEPTGQPPVRLCEIRGREGRHGFGRRCQPAEPSHHGVHEADVIVAEHRVTGALHRLDGHALVAHLRGHALGDQEALLGEHHEARCHETHRRHERPRVEEAEDGALVPVAERRELDVDVDGAPLRVHPHERRAPGSGRDREERLVGPALDPGREREGGVDVDGGARRQPVGDEARHESAERVAHHDVGRPVEQRRDCLHHVARPGLRRVALRPGAAPMPGEVDGQHAEVVLLEFGRDAVPGA